MDQQRRKFLFRLSTAVVTAALYRPFSRASYLLPAHIGGELGRLTLPKAQEHVRHGLFDTSKLELRSISKKTLGIRHDIFFQNGHSRQQGDMHVLVIEKEGTTYTTCYDGQQAPEFFSSGDADNLAGIVPPNESKCFDKDTLLIPLLVSANLEGWVTKAKTSKSFPHWVLAVTVG